MEHKFHFHFRIHGWAETLSMTKIWVLWLLLWWNPVERGVSLPERLIISRTKKTQAIICWFFPTKENWPWNFCWKPGTAMCVFCEFVFKRWWCWGFESTFLIGVFWWGLSISLVQQVFTVFLPIWEYLHDESARRYMKYKFLNLCTICRGIFSLIVQIKTHTYERLQDIPPTNSCS